MEKSEVETRMAELQQEVRYLKGVGEARAKALNKLGVYGA
jgi:predicted flap endonuclease-1-like 5' DNA nuclease